MHDIGLEYLHCTLTLPRILPFKFYLSWRGGGNQETITIRTEMQCLSMKDEGRQSQSKGLGAIPGICLNARLGRPPGYLLHTS